MKQEFINIKILSDDDYIKLEKELGSSVIYFAFRHRGRELPMIKSNSVHYLSVSSVVWLLNDL